ncbi:MAG: helix-turn-helix transcriptional regulator [Myxococcota bacterium]
MLLGELCERNRGDFAAAFRVVQLADQQIRVVGILSHGAPGLVPLASRLEGTPYGRLNPSVGTLPPLNRWNVRARGNLASGWVGERVWDVMGIGSQLGCLVVFDGRVWGWIGTLRWKNRDPFTAEDEVSAQPPARELVKRIAHAERGQAEVPAMPGCALVVDGQVRMSDGRWPDDEPRLRRFLDGLEAPQAGGTRFGYIDGAVFEAHVMTGAAGAAWLVRSERAARIAATPLLELSPKQREVAEMAARGATVAEIARAIGATENTVKTHLKRAYEACGIATRAELLDLVNATVPPESLRR